MGQLEQLLEGGSAARWAMPTQPGDMAQRSSHSESRLRIERPTYEDERQLRVLLIEYNPGDADLAQEHLKE